MCAITSCGTQGETGPKGETGAQGPKGETGEKGDKGDTFYPVVVLSKGVTTDVVSGKSGDTYTLTFTGWDATHQVVNKLFINYEEVELTDEIINGSYTGTFSDEGSNGAVVVSAEFGTVVSYATSLLKDYYDALVENDSDLKSTAETATDEKGTRTSYYNNDLKNEVYQNGIAAITAADNSEKTVSERLALVREALTEQEEAISTKYAALVSAAKTDAKAGLEKIYAAKPTDASTDTLTGRENMSDEDRASMLSAAKAAVDSCTTLAGIGALVNYQTTVANNGDGTGSYNKLEVARASVFKAISDALNNVHTGDSAFAVNGEGSDYEAVVDKLEEYGFEDSALPYEVAKTYIAKASAATELPVVSSEDPTIALAKEAKEKIEGAYTSIMNTLQDKIVAAYDVEINEYSNDAQWVATAHAEVKNLLQNWVKSSTRTLNGKTLEAVKVSTLVSYKGTGDGSTNEYGGLGYVETMLEKWNEPFTEWRIEQVTEDVKANVVAYAKEITDGDSVYNSFLTSEEENNLKDKTTDDDPAVYDYNVTEYAKAWAPTSTKINEIKDSETEAKASVKSVYEAAFKEYVSNYTNYKANSDILDSTNYAAYDSIASKVTGYATVGLTVGTDTTQVVYLGNDLTRLQDAYKAAMYNDEGTYAVANRKASTFADVDTWVKNFKSYLSLLKKLNTGVEGNEEINEKDILATSIKAEKDKIIAGEVTTEAEVTSFVSNLQSEYDTAVASYLADAKEALAELRDIKIGETTNIAKVNAIKTAYTNGLAAIAATESGEDDSSENKYPCKTKASVNAWYTYASGLITAASV